MIDQLPPSQLFPHYAELPYSVRVLFTATLLILGLGYLFALLNIYFTYGGRAGGNSMMITYEDMVAVYSGNEQGSILEGALQGPMATMLPPDERTALLSWVRQGAAAGDLRLHYQADHRQAVRSLSRRQQSASYQPVRLR